MTGPTADPSTDDARLRRLAALAVDAVAQAGAGGAPDHVDDDPVARRVTHVVGAIAAARPSAR